MPSSAPTEPFSAAGLPVAARLDDLGQALARGANAVLVAPPGAGKTSAVAPFLLGADWLSGRRILLMLPRRLAARAAATRIAALLGEEVGRRVGYRTRLDSLVGPGCRIECLTEGVFVRRLIADPELADTGLLLFDEVHERNLEGDLGLALALDVQEGLRPDLRILAMSATVDGARFADLMGDAALIESAGRQFPVDIHHVGRDPAERLEDAMARTIAMALSAGDGSLLAFLPGVAEIERVAERLRLPAGTELHRLHGQADPRAQAAAVAPSPMRKCVLATSIAETSLTIDGVRLVVDSGLSRRPRHDRGSGLTRLTTGRATQATITQRAGRAGRQGPGTVWRLWEAGETRARAAYDPPAILDADLAPLVLDLAAFGVTAPKTLRWLDPPPAAAVAEARARLSAMGALDADGRLSADGRRLTRLPLPPDLGHMLLEAARRGAADTGARLALLVQERGLGGRSSDMADRLAQFAADRSPRGAQARALAGRWAEQARRLVEAPSPGPVDPATLLALAFPGRVARRRGAVAKDGARYLMANGSGAIADPADPLAQAEWLVVADAGGSGADARLRLGAAFSAEAAAAWCAARADREVRVAPDPASGRWRAERVERLGAIPLGRTPAAAPPQAVADALAAEVRRAGLGGLSWPAAEQMLRQRAAFARAHGLDIAALDDEALLARLDDWLLPRLGTVDRLADISLDGTMAALLGRDGLHRLDRFAPAIFATPAGTRHVIGYDGPEAEVEVRVQALFGLGTHPMLAGGGVPLTLALTSPAGRILQKTRDLPAFWRGSWADVRREMKGRYPKHPWPEDPAGASPTVRTKAAARTSG